MRGVVVAMAGVAAVLLLTGAKGCSTSSGGGGSDFEDGMNRDTAIGACEGSVKKQLKAPATADFGGEDAVKVGSDGYRVHGYVDAENSFGANLRITWSCLAVLHE